MSLAVAADDSLVLRVFRFDPDLDARPSYARYAIPLTQVGPRAVIGDLLEYVSDEIDSSLAYRYECRTRQCGSCAIEVDGLPCLLCANPVGNRTSLTLDPLSQLPVVRDLVTDRSQLLAPLLSTTDGVVAHDSQSATRSAGPQAVSTTVERSIRIFEECAECCLCTTVCPAYDSSAFAGPMHFNKLAFNAAVSGDLAAARAEAKRLSITDCKTCFRCEDVCPHQIPIRRLSIATLLPGARSAIPSAFDGGEDA
jgi:fumarate reductase (CoM/CoB) subunit B